MTEKNKIYKSQEGFVETPIKRGFTEIQEIYSIIKNHHAFICGGWVRYMASPRKNPIKAGDIDIYCESEKSFEELKNIFLIEKKLSKRHENDISFTFAIPETGSLSTSPTIQLIKPVKEGKIVSIGTMQEILENFDFTVIRAGLLSENLALVDADFEHDEKYTLLRLKNIHCPISSTLRCMKYAKKGYFLRPLEALKLFIDWEKRTVEYKEKIIAYLDKTDKEEGLTQEQIDELERLMRID